MKKVIFAILLMLCLGATSAWCKSIIMVMDDSGFVTDLYKIKEKEHISNNYVEFTDQFGDKVQVIGNIKIIIFDNRNEKEWDEYKEYHYYKEQRHIKK